MDTDQQTVPEIGDNEIRDELPDKVDSFPSFDKEISTFILHIAGLSSTLGITMKAIGEAFIKVLKIYNEFEKANISFEEMGGEKVLLVKVEHVQQFEDLNRQLRAYSQAVKAVPRSYVMSLISQYDAFLGRLLRVIFLTKPQLLNSSERNLTFSQLVEFGSVEDAKEFILEKEIEGVLRKSHIEQFQWMEKKFDMTLRKGLDVWPIFVEVTERRNLFVHTGGNVSSQYLKNCKENQVDLSEVKLGDELKVTREYLRKHIT